MDGYKYWTMGASFEETIILNRQKLFDEFDTLEKPETNYYEEDDFRKAAEDVKRFNKAVFEIGCNSGKLVNESFITPERYLAVEPSKRLAAAFKTEHLEFSKSIINRPFEECTRQWKEMEDCVLVALFDSASYIMKPYLKIIAQTEKPYYLMFYEQGFCPEPFKAMHHFNLSMEELHELFPTAQITHKRNYYVVASK